MTTHQAVYKSNICKITGSERTGYKKVKERVIEESNSSWSSSVAMLRRMIERPGSVDYCKLSEVISREDSYPHQWFSPLTWMVTGR